MTLTKRTVVALAMAGLFSLPVAYEAAAQDGSAPSQKQLDLSAARAQRKALVGSNMKLTPDQAKAFWPVYDQYQNKMDRLDQRQANEIKEFAKNYQGLTDAQANKKLDDVEDILQARLNVEKAYIPKFRAVLPGTQVTRFFQVDHKIRALIQCEIAQGVPLARAPSASASAGAADQ